VASDGNKMSFQNIVGWKKKLKVLENVPPQKKRITIVKVTCHHHKPSDQNYVSSMVKIITFD
jgi:hypothetical protein